MPLKYWDEAFIAAVYLINRLPTKLLEFSTPLEILENIKPDYASMRIFGCACYPNLRPFNARKLEYRSTQCTFLGYSNIHKGFKCLDHKTGRIYISRDVVFDETLFPFSKLHSKAGARLQSEILLLPSHLLNPSQLDHGGENKDDPIVTNVLVNPATNGNCEHAENAATGGDLQDLALGGNSATNVPERHDFMPDSTMSRRGTEAQGHAGSTAGQEAETASTRISRQPHNQRARAMPARPDPHARTPATGGPHSRAAALGMGSTAAPSTTSSRHTGRAGSTAAGGDPGADTGRDPGEDSPALTGSASPSMPEIQGAGSSAPTDPPAGAASWVSTRLRTGTIQPKQYKNIIRYANLTTSGEPNNLGEALSNKS